MFRNLTIVILIFAAGIFTIGCDNQRTETSSTSKVDTLTIHDTVYVDSASTEIVNNNMIIRNGGEFDTIVAVGRLLFSRSQNRVVSDSLFITSDSYHGKVFLGILDDFSLRLSGGHIERYQLLRMGSRWWPGQKVIIIVEREQRTGRIQKFQFAES